jgi:hypothetical protein
MAGHIAVVVLIFQFMGMEDLQDTIEKTYFIPEMHSLTEKSL